MNLWWLLALLPVLLCPRVRRWWYNRDRQIYRYWDGRRLRRADPFVIYRKIVNDDEFDWDETPKQVDYGPTEKDRLDAQRITAKCVRNSFDLKRFDGRNGLTEEECINLLAGFVDWMTDLKKNTSTPVTSPESTGPPSSEGSTTNADSHSSS